MQQAAASTSCGTPATDDLLHCKYASEVFLCLQDIVWTARKGGGGLGCRSHRRGVTGSRGPGRAWSTFTKKDDAVHRLLNKGLLLGAMAPWARSPHSALSPNQRRHYNKLTTFCGLRSLSEEIPKNLQTGVHTCTRMPSSPAGFHATSYGPFERESPRILVPGV